VVTVVISEYVVGHWWEQLLHNQSALRLKARLLFQPGVVVIDVPWHLRSAGVPPAVAVEPVEGMDRRTRTGTEGVATGGQEPRDVPDTTTGA
jgi:hypothetical protein